MLIYLLYPNNALSLHAESLNIPKYLALEGSATILTRCMPGPRPSGPTSSTRQFWPIHRLLDWVDWLHKERPDWVDWIDGGPTEWIHRSTQWSGLPAWWRVGVLLRNGMKATQMPDAWSLMSYDASQLESPRGSKMKGYSKWNESKTKTCWLKVVCVGMMIS